MDKPTLDERLSRMMVAFHDGHWWTVYLYNAKDAQYYSTCKTVGEWEALKPEERQKIINNLLG